MDQALGYNNEYSHQRSRSRSPSNRRGSIDRNDSYGRFGARGFHGRRGGRGGFRGGRGGYRGGRGSGYSFGGRRDDFRDMPPKRERIYDNSIFIGNLSFDCTEDDLRDFFQSAGDIVSTEIITRRGRHKGMGTVEFTNQQAVDEAISRFNNVEFMGRELFIKQDQPPPNKRGDEPSMFDRIQPNDGYRNNTREDTIYSGNQNNNPQDYDYNAPRQQRSQSYEVFILNLPFAFSWQNLKDLFRECGNVLRADIQLDYNGYSRGFGNVFYGTKEEMYRAIDTFNGYDLDGRILEVREGRSNQHHDNGRNEPYQDRHKSYPDRRDSYPDRRDSYQERRGSYRDDDQQDFFQDRNNQQLEGGNHFGNQPEQQFNQQIPQAPQEQSTHGPTKFTEGVTGNGERSSLVYCENLPLTTSTNDLYELFESLGRVQYAELKYDTTGAPTGIAIIDYDDINSADLCVNKLNNYNYGGQDLSVSFGQRSN